MMNVHKRGAGNIQKNIGLDVNTYYQYLEKCDCHSMIMESRKKKQV